jgi:hypothetical protein
MSSISAVFDSDNISNNGRFSRRETFVPWKPTGAGSSNISGVIQSLQHRSGDELGIDSYALLNTSYYSIIEWIRAQRMNHLPAEGSSYDKVLAWAQLFVERLNKFDENIQGFAGDNYLAAQMSYGYCYMLLQVCGNQLSSYQFGTILTSSYSSVRRMPRH